MKKAIPYFLLCVAIVGGCRKNPIERLVNPYGDAAVPGISGTFFIFDEELKTAGAVAFIPFGENQEIDFSDKTSPRRSTNHMRYRWNGGDTSGDTGPQHDFAGFSLLTAATVATSSASAGRNLQTPGYTRLIFWVRGTLTSGNRLRIEGPDDGDPLTLPARVEFTADQLADWQEVTLTVPAGDFASVKAFMTASIQYDQPPRTTVAGDGGTIFFDDIRYD